MRRVACHAGVAAADVVSRRPNPFVQARARGSRRPASGCSGGSICPPMQQRRSGPLRRPRPAALNTSILMSSQQAAQWVKCHHVVDLLAGSAGLRLRVAGLCRLAPCGYGSAAWRQPCAFSRPAVPTRPARPGCSLHRDVSVSHVSSLPCWLGGPSAKLRIRSVGRRGTRSGSAGPACSTRRAVGSIRTRVARPPSSAAAGSSQSVHSSYPLQPSSVILNISAVLQVRFGHRA